MSKLLRYCRLVYKNGYVYKFFGVRSLIYADNGRVLITYRLRGLETTFACDISEIKLLSWECYYE